MKQKKLKLKLSIFVASIGLAIAGMGNNVQAAVTKHVDLPYGYTKTIVSKAANGNKYAIHYLAPISRNGMVNNQFTDTNHSDERMIDPVNLTKKDQTEIAKYALSVINSARKQMHQPNWKYSKAAMNFARRVANNYYHDGASIMDDDHDVHAIVKAARQSGLNSKLGQVYEDEAGLPSYDNYHTAKRTMKQLKEDIYYNIKQMLFGGFYGNNYNDLAKYNEYEHARDLLSLNQDKSLYKRQFGLSFSNLPDRQGLVSVHMLGVAKPYIQNYKKFK